MTFLDLVDDFNLFNSVGHEGRENQIDIFERELVLTTSGSQLRSFRFFMNVHEYYIVIGTLVSSPTERGCKKLRFLISEGQCVITNDINSFLGHLSHAEFESHAVELSSYHTLRYRVVMSRCDQEVRFRSRD